MVFTEPRLCSNRCRGPGASAALRSRNCDPPEYRRPCRRLRPIPAGDPYGTPGNSSKTRNGWYRFCWCASETIYQACSLSTVRRFRGQSAETWRWTTPSRDAMNLIGKSAFSATREPIGHFGSTFSWAKKADGIERANHAPISQHTVRTRLSLVNSWRSSVDIPGARQLRRSAAWETLTVANRKPATSS